MIKIVLPTGAGPKTSSGVKVYTESGEEIKHISRIEIDMQPDSVLEAKLTICVADIENLEGLLPQISLDQPEDEHQAIGDDVPADDISAITEKFCR